MLTQMKSKILLFASLAILVLVSFLMGSMPSSTQTAHAAYSQTITPVPTKVTGAHLSITGVSVELIIDENDDGLIDPGDNIRFLITYVNSGNVVVENVVIIDEYAKEVVEKIGNISHNGTVRENKITWEIGRVQSGARGQVSYEVQILGEFPADGSKDASNTISIQGLNSETFIFTPSIVIQIPKLSFAKTWELIKDVNSNDKPDPGDTLEYTIIVRNVGDVDAANVLIEDNFDELHFDSPSNISLNGKSGGDIIEWNIRELKSGGFSQVSYRLMLNSNFSDGETTVKNSVMVSAKGIESKISEYKFDVDVPTPTPPTPAPLSPTPAPPPVAAGTSEGSSLDGIYLAWLTGGLLVGAFITLSIMAFSTRIKDEYRSDVVRDGFIITLVVGAALTLALAGAIEHSAAAGILGTVAGYLLKSVQHN